MIDAPARRAAVPQNGRLDTMRRRMGACILIAQGLDPFAAMTLIKERREVADPYAYYIQPRILKFAEQWNK